MQRVFVQSFGCRASQADGAAIEASLKDCGFSAAPNSASADLIVLNTCTVTHAADVDARRTVRNLHCDHPDAKILVTGCYAQRAPEEIAGLEGVRWVVGNSHKHSIPEIVLGSKEEYHGQILVSDISAQPEFIAAPVSGIREDRTRPNLKVQDGCSNRCSFCIIPSVRGKSRSAPLASVLDQLAVLSERYCEIVLSGLNLGRWGRELPERLRFVDLLTAILRRTSVRRLRISSVEPMDWNEELMELVANEPRIAKHVHLPLQSGSDSVLKRMFRKYRTRHYASRLEIARRLMPDAAIGADVMTGFPGETDAEFAETVSFIEQQPFTYLHVFTYSERPGTLAAERGDAVRMDIRRERTNILRALSERKNLEFRRGMIGKTLPAVSLEQPGSALTTNFLKVRMAQERGPNQLVDLEIGGVTEIGLRERALLPII
ncbi:MAG: tRNA (N(6)-L-threonylcarbamoyladenosine(37)-C(2))-methylthiotransferase MtaB [Acidobacteriaceae bacterium]|nr:tRNA (N(6)-L-threonylcarbamoyladenosine(37)-C(2))-methylthiotransferase MtaB [Acidobacteriaceae bacterium]MBV9766622.1 tRNA (N(6)-L-threonylcarbamoyladenosine(37)-C(2))-methylthiotransferase MtaB [Acidobacteriaceae bacterium]